MKFPALVISSLFVLSLTSFTIERTPKKRNDRNKPTRVLVISDLNSSYGSTTYSPEVTAVISKLDSIKPDIILCAGDMVAGQKKTLTEANIRDMWSAFDNHVLQPISRLGISFGFTVGNHDASPSYKLDRDLAKEFWKGNVAKTNLAFADSSNFPYYFSYVKNNIFFISWDAAGAEVPKEVFEWMDGQLRSKKAQKARLRILLGHLPLYPIVESKNKRGEFISAADSALLFMRKHNVDLYISGHQHAYFPASRDGVRLLNAGAIGDGPRKIMGHSADAKKAYTVFEIPAKRAKTFEYQTFVPLKGERIDHNSLPDSVVGINGTIRREK